MLSQWQEHPYKPGPNPAAPPKVTAPRKQPKVHLFVKRTRLEGEGAEIGRMLPRPEDLGSTIPSADDVPESGASASAPSTITLNVGSQNRTGRSMRLQRMMVGLTEEPTAQTLGMEENDEDDAARAAKKAASGKSVKRVDPNNVADQGFTRRQDRAIEDRRKLRFDRVQRCRNGGVIVRATVGGNERMNRGRDNFGTGSKRVRDTWDVYCEVDSDDELSEKVGATGLGGGFGDDDDDDDDDQWWRTYHDAPSNFDYAAASKAPIGSAEWEQWMLVGVPEDDEELFFLDVDPNDDAHDFLFDHRDDDDYDSNREDQDCYDYPTESDSDDPAKASDIRAVGFAGAFRKQANPFKPAGARPGQQDALTLGKPRSTGPGGNLGFGDSDDDAEGNNGANDDDWNLGSDDDDDFDSDGSDTDQFWSAAGKREEYRAELRAERREKMQFKSTTHAAFCGEEFADVDDDEDIYRAMARHDVADYDSDDLADYAMPADDVEFRIRGDAYGDDDDGY